MSKLKYLEFGLYKNNLNTVSYACEPLIFSLILLTDDVGLLPTAVARASTSKADCSGCPTSAMFACGTTSCASAR